MVIRKENEKEIDFIAKNATTKCYIQVTKFMNKPFRYEHKFMPFRKICDNYKKIVIANDCVNPIIQDGIK